jgi:hypothetical protein
VERGFDYLIRAAFYQAGFERVIWECRRKKKEQDTMGMMIVRHKVRDYDVWRSLFDAHVEARKSAGLSHPRVMRSADDANELVLIFDDMDTDRAKEFANSEDLKENMMKAGVIDKPTIYFLESITDHPRGHSHGTGGLADAKHGRHGPFN